MNLTNEGAMICTQAAWLHTHDSMHLRGFACLPSYIRAFRRGLGHTDPSRGLLSGTDSAWLLSHLQSKLPGHNYPPSPAVSAAAARLLAGAISHGPAWECFLLSSLSLSLRQGGECEIQGTDEQTEVWRGEGICLQSPSGKRVDKNRTLM